MRWGGAGLIAAVLALAGCKSTSDPKSKDREPPGLAAARNKVKEPKDPKSPTWLDAVAKGPVADTGVPKAGAWNHDPKSPNFDPKAAAQDVIGGKVVDAYGRPAKNVFIRVEAVNDPPGTAALGILSNDAGYFLSNGLKPGQTYNLRAEATQEGKQLVGSVQTRVPNPILLITLREDLGGLPPTNDPKRPGGANDNFPPSPSPTGGDHIPPMGLGPVGTPNPRTPRQDDAFSPEVGSTRSLPPSIGGGVSPTTRPNPTVGPGGLPPPDDLSQPPGTPHRPENIADGPTKNPFTAPPASVPGPNVPSFPVPPVNPRGPMESRAPAPPNLRLMDSLERYWDFATDRAGSVVLLEFVTTNCPHCKPAVPVLKDAQSRYGAAGFQVVAVLCDELPRKERATAAGKYARDNNTNYAVFVEPGATPGDVRDRFDVASYPTAVLLDATGNVLWKGHPARDKVQLDAAIKKALGK
jgi:thiol-disulfide isomerase/thioredoxin